MSKLLFVALILGGVAGGFFGHDLLTQADFDEFATQCEAQLVEHRAVERAQNSYFKTCLGELERAAVDQNNTARRLASCQGRHDL